VIAHYDPSTGQFLTRDPLESLTREPYGYASANPANRRDPTGLFDVPEFVPVVGGMCVDIADPDCVTAQEGQPNDVADFAGGMIDANPITAPLPLDLAGNGVRTQSGSAYAGRLTIVIIET
jgi:hypothetical protein